MHPDLSLVLQKSASNLNLKHKSAILCKHFRSCTNKAMSNSLTVSNSGPDEECQDLVRIVSDEEEEDEQERLEGALRKDFEDDNNSLGSELSVGRENTVSSNHHELEEEDEVLDISDTHSNTSTEDMLHSPTMALNSPVETPINPFALAHTLRFPGPFGVPASNTTPSVINVSPFQEEFLRKSHIYAEELMKHQMQLMAAARASAFSLGSNNLSQSQIASPGNLLQLNSLTKIDQIKAAAAAALTAAAQQNKPLNPRNPHQILPSHQTTHYTYSLSTDTLAKLTDLSKQHIAKPVIPMSTLNQLKTQMQAHLPGLLPDNNDNLHERALKFSIDNILKADFGRSSSLDSSSQLRKSRKKLTTSSSSCTETVDHLLNHHSSSPSTHPFSSSLATFCTNSNDSSSTAVSSSYGSTNGAVIVNSIDLLKSSSPSQTPSISPGFLNNSDNNSFIIRPSVDKSEESSTSAVTTTITTSTTTSSKSSTCTGTGASGSGPIVWPAWVYCTRYSDRPSSGKLQIIFLFSCLKLTVIYNLSYNCLIIISIKSDSQTIFNKGLWVVK